MPWLLLLGTFVTILCSYATLGIMCNGFYECEVAGQVATWIAAFVTFHCNSKTVVGACFKTGTSSGIAGQQRARAPEKRLLVCPQEQMKMVRL